MIAEGHNDHTVTAIAARTRRAEHASDVPACGIRHGIQGSVAEE
jgi:hypothetical protein